MNPISFSMWPGYRARLSFKGLVFKSEKSRFTVKSKSFHQTDEDNKMFSWLITTFLNRPTYYIALHKMSSPDVNEVAALDPSF